MFFGRVTFILLLLEMLTTAFAIFLPFEEIIFVWAWLKLTLFGMLTFTGVALPGITLACCAEGFALGDALLGEVGVALGVGVGVALGVGAGATPPPLLAGAVDAGVTPATVTDVDSIERAPAPIAFVAST